MLRRRGCNADIMSSGILIDSVFMATSLYLQCPFDGIILVAADERTQRFQLLQRLRQGDSPLFQQEYNANGGGYIRDVQCPQPPDKPFIVAQDRIEPAFLKNVQEKTGVLL